MKKQKNIILCLLFSSVLWAGNWFTSDEPLIGSSTQGTFAGTAGAQFLKIGGGARAIAMGGAYVALRGDVQSIYWNPASLAGLTDSRFSVSHSSWFADINYENISYVSKLGNVVAGITFTGLLSGQIEETTEWEPDGTGRMWTANDYALGITFARNLTNKFAAGLMMKIVSQNIDRASSMGWAFDIGGTYDSGLGNDFRIGFSVRNFGPDMQYRGQGLESQTQYFKWLQGNQWRNDLSESDVKMMWLSDKYAMPMVFQVGIAYDLFEFGEQKLLMTLDGINAIDQNEQLALGFEFGFADTYFMRIGFNEFLKTKKFSSRDKDGEWTYEPYNMGLRAGFGADLTRAAQLPMRIDYAFQTHPYLPNVHRFTVDMGF